MSNISAINKIIMEHHGVDIHPHFSSEDLALGAIDLYEDYLESSRTTPAPGNFTVISKAIDLVKEAAPKIVEVVTNNLVSMSSNNSMSPHSTEVVLSRPLETIVVVPVLDNTTSISTSSIPNLRPAEQVF
jgi:hypothetical protein